MASETFYPVGIVYARGSGEKRQEVILPFEARSIPDYGSTYTYGFAAPGETPVEWFEAEAEERFGSIANGPVCFEGAREEHGYIIYDYEVESFSFILIDGGTAAVNGKKIETDEVWLNHGDHLTLGNTTLVFFIDMAPWKMCAHGHCLKHMSVANGWFHREPEYANTLLSAATQLVFFDRGSPAKKRLREEDNQVNDVATKKPRNA